MSLAASDAETACRNVTVLRRLLSRLPRDDMIDFASQWEISLDPGPRAVDSFIRGMWKGVSHERFAQMDLKTVQLDKKRAWTALRANYDEDDRGPPAGLTAASFRQSMSRTLGALTRHHVWADLHNGNIWARVALLDGTSSPDSSRVASEVVYIVHVSGTPYVLCTSVKPVSRPLVHQAISTALCASGVSPQGLKAGDVASAERLLTLYRAADPATLTHMRRLNSNPLDASAAKRVKLAAAADREDVSAVSAEPLDKAARRESERRRNGVLGDAALPSLPSLSFDTSSALGAGAGIFRFQVSFEGDSVLEGLRKLATVPGALEGGALPQFLQDVASENVNAFAVGTGGELTRASGEALAAGNSL